SSTVAVVVLCSPLVSAAPRSEEYSGPLSAAESLVLFLVSLCFAGVVALVVIHSGLPGLRLLRARPMCYLGQVSYGIYLYNFPIVYGLANHYGRSALPVSVGIGVFLLCILVGALSWELFEKPLVALKRWLPYH
ncbi:acyltransferase family protein, partial [Singulisphaera rosea]